MPNYGVLDEKRYFTSGNKLLIFKSGNFTFGIQICEDVWQARGPAYELAKIGVDLILVLNASPYYLEKWKKRENISKNIIKNKKSAIAYLNMVGGQDEIDPLGQHVRGDEYPPRWSRQHGTIVAGADDHAGVRRGVGPQSANEFKLVHERHPSARSRRA